MHLDGGFETARKFVIAHWRDRMINWQGPLRDAKTTLQEWAQGRGLADARLCHRRRAAAPITPRLSRSKSGSTRARRGAATGKTRRDAEQAAASAVLLREGVWKAAGGGI